MAAKKPADEAVVSAGAYLAASRFGTEVVRLVLDLARDRVGSDRAANVVRLSEGEVVQALNDPSFIADLLDRVQEHTDDGRASRVVRRAG